MDREFTLIEKLFKKRIKEIPLGVGDDGALIEKNKQTYYVISQDTMNEGTHFFSNHAPRKLGWKVLAKTFHPNFLGAWFEKKCVPSFIVS